jgi:hypothetical protein
VKLNDARFIQIYKVGGLFWEVFEVIGYIVKDVGKGAEPC